jgi:glucose dehydrogenase
MGIRNRLLSSTLLAGSMLAAWPVLAADVTPERLSIRSRRTGWWTTAHDAQRYSPLDKINKENVKDLRIAYAVAIGGTAANENLEATPLAEDGDPEASRNAGGSILGGMSRYTERNTSDIVVVDPFTGDVKKKMRKPYPNRSAALTTAGGVLFTGYVDGSFAAYDDVSLEQLWEVNVGTGFNAPPMTFEVGGKQYVAILTGLSRNSRAALVNTPELREMRSQTMLFVFGL